MDVLSVVRGQGMFPEHSAAGFGAQMKKRIRLVGVCLLVVVAGIAWMLSAGRHSDPSPVWNTYRTGRGAAQEITLSGRSTIILNTDSELHVLASGTQRKVQLVRGEALLNIAHDPQHPFEVSAANLAIRDLGTTFSVRLRDDQEADVLVREGKVVVDQMSGTPGSNVDPATWRRLAELSGGDAFELRAGVMRVRRLSLSEIDRRLAWLTGHLAFQGQTIGEAITEFNRYGQRQLKVADPAVAAIPIAGVFQTTNAEGFVSALTKIYAIRAESAKDSGSATVLRRDAH